MRPIKYKAYLKEHKETVSVDAIDFIEEEITVVDEFGNDYHFRFSEIELRQYTGLKDKNGREIYEGHIIEVSPVNRENYSTNSIFWVRSDRTIWGYEFDWVHVSGYDCSTHIIESDDEWTQLLNTEVIGNIYEDKHLLEVQR